MQIVDRSKEPAPACLSDHRSKDARDALLLLFSQDQRRQAQTRISMSKLAVRDPELDYALLRLFNRRCAFCEQQVPTRAYRFRPMEEAGPRDQAPVEHRDRAHLYYAWLTNAWQNIYPICEACLPVEPSIFPVRGRRVPLPSEAEVQEYVRNPTGSWRSKVGERALFLDPCSRADLRKHLAFVPDGTVLSLSSSGDATITQFNLNRPDLVSHRATLFDAYFQELTANDRLERMETLEFSKLEHGGAWYLLLYQVARRAGSPRAPLSREKIAAYLRQNATDQEFITRFFHAWESLQKNPFQLVEKAPRPAPIVSGGPFPTRFEIRNFKALEELDVDLAALVTGTRSNPALAPVLVILGENAAGKSSLLEAMTLALCGDDEREAAAPDSKPFMLDPSMMGETQRTASRRGSVGVTYEDGSKALLEISARGFQREVVPGSSPMSGRTPVFAYGAYRLFQKDGVPRGAAKRIRSLFAVGYPLSNPDEWLYSIHTTPLFNDVVRALRSILSIGQAFETIEPDQRTQRCVLVVRSERSDGIVVLSRIPLALISSGFRAVFGTACDIMRNLDASRGARGTTLAKSRAVILIDEVEAHLHPRWKMGIVRGLREALPNALFIATTHDPLCLRGLSAGEVRVLRRRTRDLDDPDGLPTIVEQVDTLPPIGALTVEQLLTSDLFQLFSTDDDTVEAGLAGVGDLLAAERSGRLRAHEFEDLEHIRQRIRSDVAKSLPVGSTEVEQLVQGAVEDYLRVRAHTPAATLSSLRADTRRRIVEALRRS